tara:strand:+ start:129 stop:818 length:690 start_codon:yes stop_codon:yes gene_type:complete
MIKSIKRDLQTLYDGVPATRCAGSGECCQLTPEEFDNHYATMFPLYRVEYLNIVEHVEREMPAERRDALLAHTEERPRRCPFLGANQGCTIYPVRPLICRTYGVMNPRSIQREAAHMVGQVPDRWIRDFSRREGAMVCPRVAVLEPEKVKLHAQRTADGTYERELTRLSLQVDVAVGERRTIFKHISGRRNWPIRWSWGGYNTVRFAPLKWLRAHFEAYWKRAELADAG